MYTAPASSPVVAPTIMSSRILFRTIAFAMMIKSRAVGTWPRRRVHRPRGALPSSSAWPSCGQGAQQAAAGADSDPVSGTAARAPQGLAHLLHFAGIAVTGEQHGERVLGCADGLARATQREQRAGAAVRWTRPCRARRPGRGRPGRTGRSPRARSTVGAGAERPPGTDPAAAAPVRPAGDDERARIVAALAACVGNQTRAAKLLGVSRATLATRVVVHGIPRPRSR